MKGRGGRPCGPPAHRTNVLIREDAWRLAQKSNINISEFFSEVLVKTLGDRTEIELSEIRQRKVKLETELGELNGRELLLLNDLRNKSSRLMEIRAEELSDAYYLKELLVTKLVDGRTRKRSHFRAGFMIDVDADALDADMRAGKVTRDSPLEDFMRYSPRIMKASFRKEIKEKMILEMQQQAAIQQEVPR